MPTQSETRQQVPTAGRRAVDTNPGPPQTTADEEVPNAAALPTSGGLCASWEEPAHTTLPATPAPLPVPADDPSYSISLLADQKRAPPPPASDAIPATNSARP